MADLSGYGAGRYLKADEVKQIIASGKAPVATIATEAVLVATPFKNKDGSPVSRAQMDVEFEDGTERTVAINATSANAIKAAYGTESTTWVGKKVRFEIAKVNNPSKGGLVDAVFVYPVEAQASPATASGTVEVKQVQLNADGALDGVPSADGRVKIQIVKDGLGSAVVPFEGKAFNFVKGSIHSLTEKDAQFLINNGFATKLIAIDLTG